MKLLLIRHAESKYNKLVSDTEKSMNLASDAKNLILFTKCIKDPELLDCDISQHGYEQIAQSLAANAAALKNVKLVLVSPMNRALTTAKHMFDPLVNNGQDIKFLVVPHLREVLESQCDIVLSCHDKLAKFPGFDFSLVLELEKKFGFEWFIHSKLDQYTKQLMLKKVQAKENLTDIEKSFALIDFLNEHLPAYMEQHYEVLHRTIVFKTWLKEFLKQNQYKEGEVAVVGHSCYFKQLTGSDFNSHQVPQTCRWLKNCEVYEYHVDL
jgi:phosphohistidine phosphatase SixA